jgi:peptide/nickel transport system permease protein
MFGYLLRRLVELAAVLAIGSVVVWGIVYAVPGSPAAAMVGAGATPEELAAAEARLGLDQPMLLQYFHWIGRILRLDLGTSIITGLDIKAQLLARLPATIQLTVLTVLLSVAVGVPLGIFAVIRSGTRLGKLILGAQALTLAIPTFWIALLLVALFSVELKMLPSVSRYVPVFDDPLAALRNAILPAASLAFYFSGILSRFTAASLEETLAQDFVRAARAKGVPEHKVVLKRALRNALIPVVTVIGLQIGTLLGGAIVIEAVFSYPGIGRLLLSAIVSRDYPVIQACIMFAIIGFLAISIVVDLLYAVLDPRVRR